ncbi:hypothetical protein F5B19DRAFT_140790 [Rostrohypoxylon terebratum]|nr:hypothetical protein F5B19DRAFT_140790 [Rostrohypoxylon terebratum]
MAFNSSSTSSSLAKKSRGSSLELQPAPLRLPPQKLDADFDGSKSGDKEEISPRPIVKAPSRRRLPAPKLGSLVSKFEILDAVNNAENNCASREQNSGIPRTRQTLGTSPRTAFVDKSSPVEEPGYVSPRQTVSPPLRGESKLPVSTLRKPGAGVSRSRAESDLSKEREPPKDGQSQMPSGSEPSLIADRRRAFENRSLYYSFTKPIELSSEQSNTQRSMPHLAKSCISGSIPSRQQSPTKPQATSPANIEHSQQASSSSGQECDLTEQSPTENQRFSSISRIPVRRGQPSVADLRKSFEKSSQPEVIPYEPIPRLRTTKLQSSNVESVDEWSIRDTPIARDSTDTIRHFPKRSLPKNSLFRKGNAHNLDGAVSLEHEDTIGQDEYSVGQDASLLPGSHDSLPHVVHPFLSTNSIGGFRNTPPKVATVEEMPTSKSRTPSKCAGKVSDLRRLFERTPSQGASPFRSFWQSRTRNRPKVETEPIAEMPPPIKIPELTTAISTDDFSCDFAVPDVLGNASSRKHEARFDIELDENLPAEQDYPTKGGIRQFERLERGSAPSRTSVSESYDDADLSPRGKENNRTRKSRGGWHPFRQRSIKLWRRISNSLIRSAGEEQAGPSNQADFDDTWSSSFCRRLRHRRSDIFSYHASRSSEAVRSPVASSYGKSSASIDDDLIAQIESRPPHMTYRQSPSLSRSFPFLARVSDSLGGTDEFDGFGFDGSLLSKATRYRTGSAAERIARSPTSTTRRGGPSALSRVLSQQTAAERKRHRLEEKQLRREEKDKKREEKAKAKNQNRDGTTKKGKEVDRKKESSWSKKTASGFVVRQIDDVKLRHPKPRRPGQVKKLVNMYKEKASSGIKIGRGGGSG